jgi:hypothetical protein
LRCRGLGMGEEYRLSRTVLCKILTTSQKAWKADVT